MAVANICYSQGIGLAGASDPSVVRHPVPIHGPLVYNTAGTAQLASNQTITVAAKIAIPAEALAANALIGITMVDGGIYVTTGVNGDTNIAVGGGWLVPASSVGYPLQIGRTPTGAQHTHLLVIAAA